MEWTNRCMATGIANCSRCWRKPKWAPIFLASRRAPSQRVHAMLIARHAKRRSRRRRSRQQGARPVPGGQVTGRAERELKSLGMFHAGSDDRNGVHSNRHRRGMGGQVTALQMVRRDVWCKCPGATCSRRNEAVPRRQRGDHVVVAACKQLCPHLADRCSCRVENVASQPWSQRAQEIGGTRLYDSGYVEMPYPVRCPRGSRSLHRRGCAPCDQRTWNCSR